MVVKKRRQLKDILVCFSLLLFSLSDGIEVMEFFEMLHDQSTLRGNKLDCRVDPYLYAVIAFILYFAS